MVSGMGDDFRNRLKDGVLHIEGLPLAEDPRCATPEECDGCRGVFDPAELFEGSCEDCSLEQAHFDEVEEAIRQGDLSYSDSSEWTFVRDAAL